MKAAAPSSSRRVPPRREMSDNDLMSESLHKIILDRSLGGDGVAATADTDEEIKEKEKQSRNEMARTATQPSSSSKATHESCKPTLVAGGGGEKPRYVPNKQSDVSARSNTTETTDGAAAADFGGGGAVGKTMINGDALPVEQQHTAEVASADCSNGTAPPAEEEETDEDYLMKVLARRSQASGGATASAATAAVASNAPAVEYDERGRPQKSRSTNSTGDASIRPGAYSGASGRGYGRVASVRNCGDLLQESSKRNSEEEGTSSRSLVLLGHQQSIRGDNLVSSLDKDLEENPVCDAACHLSSTEDRKADDSSSVNKPSIPLLAAIVAATILLVLAVAIPVSVIQSNSSEQDTSKQKTNDELQEEEWIPLVPNMTEATISAILEDPHSQQYLAYEWISDDPNWDTYENWRKQQRFALMCLYEGFSGSRFLPNRFNPRHGHDECTWLVRDPCKEDEEKKITSFVLASYQDIAFQGTLPPELAFLPWLESIELSGDIGMKSLDELIPRETLSALPIKSLRFHGSDLGGSIPSTLGLLTGLTSLEMSGTGLDSSLPSQLGLLTDLETLILSENSLTGTIPEELASLPRLTNLQIDKNAGLEEYLPSGFCATTGNSASLAWDTLQTDWCNNPTECCMA